MTAAVIPARHDRLARTLHTLRIRSTFYCHAELGEPWSLEMPAVIDSISFHVLTAGTCWLRVPGREPQEMRTGDLALVPHGRGHDLLSAPDLPTGPRVDLLPQEYLSEQYSVLTYGGSGRSTQLICGVVSFDDPPSRELVRALPPLVFVGGDTESGAFSIRDTVRLMANELMRPQPGGEAVATRLADILVVQAIRAWIVSGADAGTGWLRALEDDRVGRVLEAIHTDPGEPWSLDRLARLATMSRSAFSARFAELVGETPISYLTRWRMNLAHARLRDEGVTAAALAAELGYQSEAAFNRAFQRVVGKTPGVIRRQRRSADASASDTSPNSREGAPA